MAKTQKEKPQTISINDVEYNVNDLTQEHYDIYPCRIFSLLIF